VVPLMVLPMRPVNGPEGHRSRDSPGPSRRVA
jgi:hypothetical protein